MANYEYVPKPKNPNGKFQVSVAIALAAIGILNVWGLTILSDVKESINKNEIKIETNRTALYAKMDRVEERATKAFSDLCDRIANNTAEIKKHSVLLAIPVKDRQKYEKFFGTDK